MGIEKDGQTRIRKEVDSSLGLTLTLRMQRMLIFKRRSEERSQREKRTSIIDLPARRGSMGEHLSYFQQ